MGSNIKYTVNHGFTSSGASSPLSASYIAVGGVDTAIDQIFSAAGSLQAVAAAWLAPGTSAGDLVAVELIATQNLTIQTNGNGTIGVQTVTITGTPTGGTFALGFQGQITAPIAFNAAASAVQTALRALSTIGGTNVTCSGGPLPGSAVTCTFSGSIVNQTVPLMTSNIAGLTGGAPAIAIANSGSTPQDVIQLAAGIPLIWDSSQAFACPFLGAVTAFYVTNSVACRLQGRYLTL